MADEKNVEPQNKSTKGYGKHSVWFWVIIYVIIAIILYGLIYLIFIHKGNTTGTSSGY